MKFRIKVPAKVVISMTGDEIKALEAIAVRFSEAYEEDVDPTWVLNYNGYAGANSYLMRTDDRTNDCRIIEGKYPDDNPAAGHALEDALMGLVRSGREGRSLGRPR